MNSGTSGRWRKNHDMTRLCIMRGSRAGIGNYPESRRIVTTSRAGSYKARSPPVISRASCATQRLRAQLVDMRAQLRGRDERDIADMHGIERAEYLRLAWADPANGEVDYTALPDTELAAIGAGQ
jgi:hypothetical protein